MQSQALTQKKKNERICNYCVCEIQNQSLVNFLDETLVRKQNDLEQLYDRHTLIDKEIKNLRKQKVLQKEEIELQERQGLAELEQVCK